MPSLRIKLVNVSAGRAVTADFLPRHFIVTVRSLVHLGQNFVEDYRGVVPRRYPAHNTCIKCLSSGSTVRRRIQHRSRKIHRSLEQKFSVGNAFMKLRSRKIQIHNASEKGASAANGTPKLGEGCCIKI